MGAQLAARAQQHGVCVCATCPCMSCIQLWGYRSSTLHPTESTWAHAYPIRLDLIDLSLGGAIMPQKYLRIFIIIFIIYFGYILSQTWVFPGKLINC